MTAAGPDHRLHWHGRRRGHKLRPGRQALIDGLLPRLHIRPPETGGPIDVTAVFDGPIGDLWLEVGFGSGEHLAAQALGHPDVGFIGCEPFVNGVAALLSHVARDGLANVRVYDDDARRLFPALPEASLGRVFALFSDPWPKRRHHRRRFVGVETLDQLARVMKDGAELRLASDHMGYVRWALWHLVRHPDFAWPARCRRDWADPPADWVETRYEKKARNRGARPVYLRFLRRPRSPAGAGKNIERR